jgi:hypothetical protein
MKFRSDFVLFIAESFKRWGASSPKYFRIWRTINAILVAIGGAGVSLAQISNLFPETWAKIVFAIIGACGSYGFAMNTLTVSKPVDLPLTEKKEIQQEMKNAQ